VNQFAPTRLYGTPDDFRAFVDQAHELRLGVILDVVYNHLGPDGNYITKFSEDYFTDKYKNEWGQPLNFDGKNSKPVREYFITNARYWIREFHLDGLRLDATQQIFDCSTPHVLAEISRETRAEAEPRKIYLVAENEPQHTHLVRECASGGHGLDALWNDDFHHSAMVVLTGRNEAYYSDYRGRPQEFISALKWGFLFQGQFYTWQKQPRGGHALDLEPNRFVNFLQNHDQVANSLYGLRINQLSSPSQLKAMTALLLLAPGTPMLFQGQEFGATTPFFYFADHEPKLAKLVAKGRKEFLHQFKSLACKEIEPCFNNPESEETFLRSKLDFSERVKNCHLYQLHQDLLQLRREDSVFHKSRARGMDGAVLGTEAFVLRFFGRDGDDRLVLINMGVDLPINPSPEPLLAPPSGRPWKLIWSSESPDYGGCGTPPFDPHGFWQLPGHCAIVLGHGPKNHKNGKTNSTH
jgi:maltooligosyltrehalose trehalohydrolase